MIFSLLMLFVLIDFNGQILPNLIFILSLRLYSYLIFQKNVPPVSLLIRSSKERRGQLMLINAHVNLHNYTCACTRHSIKYKQGIITTFRLVMQCNF
jgi:hypothetical protein